MSCTSAAADTLFSLFQHTSHSLPVVHLSTTRPMLLLPPTGHVGHLAAHSSLGECGGGDEGVEGGGGSEDAAHSRSHRAARSRREGGRVGPHAPGAVAEACSRRGGSSGGVGSAMEGAGGVGPGGGGEGQQQGRCGGGGACVDGGGGGRGGGGEVRKGERVVHVHVSGRPGEEREGGEGG
ncbi:unnamed protein product [Closterium sp. NIES-53]